jgi:hypothetical protein
MVLIDDKVLYGFIWCVLRLPMMLFFV